MKKSLIYILSGIVFLGILTVVAVGTRAAETEYPPMVQKLAERFNLDPEEVGSFFIGEIEQKREQMKLRFEEWLEKAVSEGKLTEEQKQAILTKRDELQGKREELKELSSEERWEAMKELKEEMKTWAEENDINLGWVYKGIGFRRGFVKGFRWGAFSSCK